MLYLKDLPYFIGLHNVLTCLVAFWAVLRLFVRVVSTVVIAVAQFPFWNTTIVCLASRPGLWTRLLTCGQ